MSASDGGIPSEEERNFFTTIQQPFPDIVNGKINTAQFLEASKGVVALVEKFGKVFAPVKYDMSGNIQKLYERFNSDRERYVNINDMILLEKQVGGSYVTDALLWLRRALHFVHTFFHCILEDNNHGDKTEDLVPFLKRAYKETLEMYHGWMAQQLFGLLSRMCPTRSELLLTLAMEHSNREAGVLQSMEIFLSRLDVNIQSLISFYQLHGLESIAKC